MALRIIFMAEVGLAEGLQALKSCKIDRERRLLYHGNALTSEKLRAIIDTAIVQVGGLPSNTIVAGGRQSCDPHERGHGLLRAEEPIILDVFPRSQKTNPRLRSGIRGRNLFCRAALVWGDLERRWDSRVFVAGSGLGW